MKKKKKIYAHLPVFATAKFSVARPDNWNDMSKAEKDDYFLSNCGTDASLCCLCSGDIETDCEANLELISEDILELYEDED